MTRLKSSIELDVFRCTLNGINHIEASAGTGKTWNICALYIRFLLEKDFSADKILVVTFTKVAVSELRKRIRERLVQIAHSLRTRNFSNDPFIIRIFDTVLHDANGEIDLDIVIKRIHLALRTFDQAPIYTIHKFCQRALQQAPFSFGIPFSLDLETNDKALRLELAYDFWNRRVEQIASQKPAFAKWLVESGIGPSTLNTQLTNKSKKILGPKKPLDMLFLDKIFSLENIAEITVEKCFVNAAKLWSTEYNSIEKLLISKQPILNQRSHNLEAISYAMSAWDAYFSQHDVENRELPKAAFKLTRMALVKATKKGSVTPKHKFFDLAESIEISLKNIKVAHCARWLILVENWINEVSKTIALHKKAKRFLTFDDLLVNLYNSLQKRYYLVDILRDRYRVALIDEFQDTDPLQFAIFDRIFSKAGLTLFYVGDPKQAIYGFRGADLQTYFSAYARSSAHYKLSVNQRSIPTIVEACNRLFSKNARAFVFDGLDYHPIHTNSFRKHQSLVDETDNTLHTGDFRIWMLPDGDKILCKRDAQWLAAKTCSAEIARLIQGAKNGHICLGKRPLLPTDIAVLVQTNRQGRLMKRALALLKINSTALTQESVFSTIDARQLEYVLAAIDAPNDVVRLRTALSTDWFSFNAKDLWRMNQDNRNKEYDICSSCEPLAELDLISSWIKRFLHYRLLWQQRGFSSMWRKLLNELKVLERIMSIGIDGERRITDINHLAELIQTRTSVQPGISSTLCWFSARRLDGGGDDARLRLSSERNLIQVLTIHKSKGLEYAIIFCPFLNDGAFLRETPTLSIFPKVLEHNNDAESKVLKYVFPNYEKKNALRESRLEQGAEHIRLIYVALTRAIHRCYIVTGPYLSLHSTRESRRSMMNWLVSGNNQKFDEWLNNPPSDPALAKAWNAISGGPISIVPLPLIEVDSQEDVQSRKSSTTFFALHTSRPLLEEWKISSFSSIISASLHKKNSLKKLYRKGFGHDCDIDIDIKNIHFKNEIKTSHFPITFPDDDILMFPSSAIAGKCIHKLFELSNFSDSSSWPRAASSALQYYPVQAIPDLSRRLTSMMVNLVNDVVHTELIPGFRMVDLSKDKRLNEIEFFLPIQSLDLNALRELLVKYGYTNIKLNPGLLSGFLNGFIDMIIENDNRFWIIDWKSNHLGYTSDSYSEKSLNAEMSKNSYYLQALIYIVVLHRYLRNRLKNYDYEIHIAGYMYLFVRGIRPIWKSKKKSSGIYIRRPTRELIDALDRIMAG